MAVPAESDTWWLVLYVYKIDNCLLFCLLFTWKEGCGSAGRIGHLVISVVRLQNRQLLTVLLAIYLKGRLWQCRQNRALGDQCCTFTKQTIAYCSIYYLPVRKAVAVPAESGTWWSVLYVYKIDNCSLFYLLFTWKEGCGSAGRIGHLVISAVRLQNRQLPTVLLVIYL